ncbi:MAG: radical SAM protein [Candidatus Omnitrophota bacterium]
MSRDVVLVNPSNKKQVYATVSDSLVGIEPPLWTALLAAFLKERGFSVAIIDADAENYSPEETADRVLEYDPLLVGLGAIGSNPSAASTPKMAAVRAVGQLLKQRAPDLRSIIYGIHPSGLPEQTLREEPVDFLCRGEAFFPFAEFLKRLKKGDCGPEYDIKGLWYRRGNTIVDHGWADIVQDLDSLPFASWDLLPMNKYRAHNWHCFGHINERSPYAMIHTSLGCPYHCHYCNIHALYAGKPGIRYRSPEKVVEEIDLLVERYGIRHLKFLDELFIMKHPRVEKICDLLIERNYGLNIWAYARIDTVTPELLKKARAAGINWVCYGIEAGSKNVRTGVSKGRFDQEAIDRAVKMAYDAGMYILGNFMFGLPDDDMSTMHETFELAKTINCEYINFYTTMAYPGSPLYDDAVKQGLRLPETWLGFSQFSRQTVPLPTKYLSPEDVLGFRDRAFVEYFSRPEYQEKILRIFGQETVDHVKRLLTKPLQRDLLVSK